MFVCKDKDDLFSVNCGFLFGIMTVIVISVIFIFVDAGEGKQSITIFLYFYTAPIWLALYQAIYNYIDKNSQEDRFVVKEDGYGKCHLYLRKGVADLVLGLQYSSIEKAVEYICEHNEQKRIFYYMIRRRKYKEKQKCIGKIPSKRRKK